MSLNEKIHNYILEKKEEILKEYFDVLGITEADLELLPKTE